MVDGATIRVHLPDLLVLDGSVCTVPRCVSTLFTQFEPRSEDDHVVRTRDTSVSHKKACL